MASKHYPPITPIFKPNVSAKPFSVNSLGVVTFTDRRANDVTPNESLCKAYGYTFDRATNTCRAFKPTSAIQTSLRTEDNTLNGQGNTVGEGTSNSYVMGSQNTIIGNSRNNIIVGNNNTINEGINNVSVYGTLGEVTATNSIVLGGNASGDSLGERQSIAFIYGTTTDDNSTVDSFLNNTTDSYFTIPTNTICSFRSETVAVRIGGSAAAGAVGDFKAWVERGVIINKSDVLSVDSAREVIANTGTTSGWVPNVSSINQNFLLTVKGANNRDIMWSSKITLTQIKTGVTL